MNDISLFFIHYTMLYLSAYVPIFYIRVWVAQIQELFYPQYLSQCLFDSNSQKHLLSWKMKSIIKKTWNIEDAWNQGSTHSMS